MSTPIASLFDNTYRQYKAYTHDICQFLFTASGFDVRPAEHATSGKSSESSAPPQTKAPRLKGKARKQAQAETKKSPRNGTPTDSGNKIVKISVKVDQLIEMAQQIAEMPAKTVLVPKVIVAKLKKTILLRRWYSSHHIARSETQKTRATVSTERSNATHNYFVNVLENVLGLLQSASAQQHCSLEQPETKPVAHEGPQITQLDTNSFYLLEVESGEEDSNEPEPPAGGLPTDKQPKQSHRPPIKEVRKEAVLDEGDQSAQVRFGLFCLFTDMARLRNLVRDHWKQYKQGTIKLETVTLVANMAIGVVRQAELDFLEEFQTYFSGITPLDHHKLSMLLYSHLAVERGVDPEFRHHPDDPYNYDLADLGDLLLLSPAIILTEMLMTWRYPKVQCRRTRTVGGFPMDTDPSKLTPEQIHSQIQVLLADLRHDFGVIQILYNNLAGLDELTKGLCKFFADTPSPLHVFVVFGTQLLIDCKLELRNEIELPFRELWRTARLCDSQLGRFLDSRVGKPRYRTWSDQQTLGLRDLQQKVIQPLILTDKMGEAREMMDPESLVDPVIVAFNFHKQHPLLSGTWLLALRARMHDVGSQVAHSWGSLLFTSHAYNAFHKLAGLDVQWPEMDWLLSYYSKVLFVGYVPKTLEECLTNFNLMVGFKLPSLVAARRGASVSEVRKRDAGARNWAAPSPALHIFREWAAAQDHDTCTDWATRILKRLNALPHPEASVKPHLQNVGAVAQILHAKALLEVDLECLRFDFLGQHFRCMEIFAQIQSQLHPYFDKRIGPDYLTSEEEVCMLIGRILQLGVDNRSMSKPVGNPDHAMNEASRIMKKFIQKHI